MWNWLLDKSTGYGYHPGSVLEYRNKLYIGEGLAMVGLLHFAPELGYQITDELSISLVGRFQWIPQEGSPDAAGGAPAKGANSVLAKLSYGFGSQNFQFLVSLAAGGGEGFRFQVPPKPSNDPSRNLSGNDTVRAGPVIVGPGIGLSYHFVPAFAWTLEAQGLLGLPDKKGYAVDIRTGPQVAF